jgi:hypothetical protein
MSGGTPRSRRTRPAEVRFYFDADILGVARIVASLRPDVTFPGDPGAEVQRRYRGPCPVASTRVPDREWIPIVTARGWAIVTRDRHIRDRPAELAAVLEHGARLFAITSRETPLDTFRILEIVMTRWRDIERIATLPGPFVYAVARGGTSRIPLP